MTDVEACNVEVYGEDGGVFAVASDHSPDLPEPFDEPLQEWAADEYAEELDAGDEVEEAGVLVYEPHGDIIDIIRR